MTRPALVAALRSLGAAAVALAMTTACQSTPFEQSCAGGSVGVCGPYEYANIVSASVEPTMLPVADFSVDARIRVELERCRDAPAPHEVRLQAIVPDEEPGDGGTEPVRVIDLPFDEEAVDGRIDVEVANPFIATVPAETDIRLRFTARSTEGAGCDSGALEIPYRTGPPRR